MKKRIVIIINHDNIDVNLEISALTSLKNEK